MLHSQPRRILAHVLIMLLCLHHAVDASQTISSSIRSRASVERGLEIKQARPLSGARERVGSALAPLPNGSMGPGEAAGLQSLLQAGLELFTHSKMQDNTVGARTAAMLAVIPTFVVFAFMMYRIFTRSPRPLRIAAASGRLRARPTALLYIGATLAGLGFITITILLWPTQCEESSKFKCDAEWKWAFRLLFGISCALCTVLALGAYVVLFQELDTSPHISRHGFVLAGSVMAFALVVIQILLLGLVYNSWWSGGVDDTTVSTSMDELPGTISSALLFAPAIASMAIFEAFAPLNMARETENIRVWRTFLATLVSLAMFGVVLTPTSNNFKGVVMNGMASWANLHLGFAILACTCLFAYLVLVYRFSTPRRDHTRRCGMLGCNVVMHTAGIAMFVCWLGGVISFITKGVTGKNRFVGLAEYLFLGSVPFVLLYRWDGTAPVEPVRRDSRELVRLTLPTEDEDVPGAED